MDIPARKNYRKTDPATSKAAADQLQSNSMLNALLVAFYRASWQGLTAEEAAHKCGFDRYATSKRVSDLKRLRSIEPRKDEHGAIATRFGSSGRAQEVLFITRLGRLEVEEAE